MFVLICLFALTQVGVGLNNRPTQNAISSDAARHFQQAKTAEARGDWKSAEIEYREALRLAPDWAEAMVNLGIVYNRQSKSDEAVATFTRAAEINPQLLGAQLNLAITYFRAKRFADAEKPLRRALVIEPDNGQVRGLLVLTLFALEQYKEAVAFGEQLLRSGPTDGATLEVIGRAYLKLRRYDDAVRVLEARNGLKPESAEILMLLGEARDNAGDSEGALREFNKAISLSGSAPPPELHFALGYVLWKRRHYDDAESAFRRELERDHSHARSIYYLGNIALTRGDRKNAIPLLQKAADAMPQNFDAHYDFGKALLQSGQVARATDELQKAVAIDRKSSGAHYQLGLAYRQLRRDNEAQREFAVARELNKTERDNLEKKVQGEELKKKPR